MREDLRRVQRAWKKCQSSRHLDAIYTYLSAVCRLIARWAAEGREVQRADRALNRLQPMARENVFAAIVRCAADRVKANKRTRSKWSLVMRYAQDYKRGSETLDEFIKRKGGINECAARYSQRLGRRARKEPGEARRGGDERGLRRRIQRRTPLPRTHSHRHRRPHPRPPCFDTSGRQREFDGEHAGSTSRLKTGAAKGRSCSTR
jgi:hypothetical protein